MSTPPAATSYPAKILTAAAAMVAHAPAFVAASGAASAPAWGRIILLDGGSHDDQDQQRDVRAFAADGHIIKLTDGQAWAHVAPRMPEGETDDPAYRSFRRSGTIHIRLAVPAVGAHPADIVMDSLNIFGAIETDIINQFQEPHALIAGTTSLALEGIPAPQSWAHALRFAILTIDWRDIP